MYAHLRAGGKKVLRKMPAAWELARRSEVHAKGMSPDTRGGYFVKPGGTVNRIALHRGGGGPAVKWSKP